MSCGAIAVRPAQRGIRAATALAFAGLSASLLVPMSHLAPHLRAGTSGGAAGTQASALASAQVHGDDPPPVPAGSAVASETKRGVPFHGTPAVGALFIRAGGRLVRHFCTAAVVRSPQGDLLITAAHCMTGRRLTPAGRIVFAPGYHSGRFPYGLWPVTAVYADSNWTSRRDPDDDVAFLAVHGPGMPVEHYTGAERLAVGRKPPDFVQVIGYPDTESQPITCAATAHAFHPGALRQLVFYCDDYTAGTSGGPFLMKVSGRTGEGLVIGVIGGYERGGDNPSVSYSPRFLANVAALYQVAASRES